MSIYTKILIFANALSLVLIIIATLSIRKSQRIDEAKDKISIFKEAVVKSVQDLPIGHKKEITCPICGRNALVGKSPYNGNIYGQCDCGVGFIN